MPDNLLELDPDEKVIARTKRHPFSLLTILVVAGLLFILVIVGLFLVLRFQESIGYSENLNPVIIIVGFVLLLLITGITAIAVYVDRKNELVVTNENIIQVLQFSLFNRQTSQLNLAKIQDVSVDQLGPIATMLGFGTVDIETAGEQANFTFRFTPNPNILAKTIIEAHEEYTKNVSGLSHSVRL